MNDARFTVEDVETLAKALARAYGSTQAAVHRWRAKHLLDSGVVRLAADVKAEALREFAEFVRAPKQPGLDMYTVNEIALEAEHRSGADRAS